MPTNEPAPIKCPKCGADMARHTHGSLTIDRCQTCSGLWLDALELQRLLERPQTPRAVDTGAPRTGSPPSPRRLQCPRDKSPLIAMSDPMQRHVRYEQCSVCGGLFLDAGELRDLSELTLRERIRTIFA